MPTVVTIEKTIYKFHELDEASKENAINRFRYADVEYYPWWDAVYDWKHDQLEEAGVINPKITEFDLERGAYAKFEGNLNLKKWMKDQKIAVKFRTLYDRADSIINVYLGGKSVYHSADAYIEIYSYWSDDSAETCERLEKQAGEVEALLQEWYDKQCYDIVDALRNEYEYLTSDEQIQEMIEANDYDFNEYGDLE